MDAPDRDTLASLGRLLGWPSISMYMPTHPVGQDDQQDPLRFKNLLGSVADELRSKEMRPAQVDDLLGEAYRLLDDPTFWRRTAAGLAVFIRPGETSVFTIDTGLPELAMVDDRFILRHLLPSIHTQERFWLLALSKNERRLFEGDHAGLTEVPLPDTPENFKDAMRFEDADHAYRFRTESGASPQGGSLFYGMGGLPDAEKEQVWRYVHMVERGVRTATRETQDPLLLAGVEYIVSAYRAQNSYPNLAEAALLGSPDEIPPSRLHAQAIEMLRPHFESKQVADMEELESRAGSTIVSGDLREIVPAAHDGRVRVLFLSQVESAWGDYDPAARKVVRIRSERAPGDRDLADLAAVETILHGGEVHVLPTAEVLRERSGLEPPAAILRY